MRVSGGAIGLTRLILGVARQIATIAETIIKGLANIFGSLFFKKCSALKGLKQLFIQLPLHIINVPVGEAIGAIITPFAMVTSPINYSKFLYDFYTKSVNDIKHLSKNGICGIGIGEKLVILQFN